MPRTSFRRIIRSSWHFLTDVFAGGLKEGTIIEITVTNPGEVPITSNIKVQQSDLELLEELKEMGR